MKRRSNAKDEHEVPAYRDETLLSLDEAAKFITDRTLIKSKEDKRSCEDKVRKRTRYHARKTGKLRSSGDKYAFNDLITWARQSWPKEFAAFPITIEARGTAKGRGRAAGIGYALPSNIEACHSLIVDLYQQVHELQARVKVLEVDAMSWQTKIRQKNVLNARKVRQKI